MRYGFRVSVDENPAVDVERRAVFQELSSSRRTTCSMPWPVCLPRVTRFDGDVLRAPEDDAYRSAGMSQARTASA